jgi:hypothetical protein
VTGRRREGEGKEAGEGQGRPEVREVRVGRQGARGRAARFDEDGKEKVPLKSFLGCSQLSNV